VIYLDANATTPPLDEVTQAVVEAMQRNWANPSSVHRPGQIARHVVECARGEVAVLLGCNEREIIFTSGGTESVDLAIRGVMAATKRRVLVTSRLEHSAVRDLAKRLHESGEAQVIWLPCDSDGVIAVADLQRVLHERASEIALVSVMAANNETGVLQPIGEMATACDGVGVLMHTDATQWIGRMPMRFADIGVHLLSCSAHKLHGPKGVGALVVRRGTPLISTLAGGPQERERRAGTENVSGIAGFGAAATAARVWLQHDALQGTVQATLQGAALRDLFQQLVCAADASAVVNAQAAPRLWNTCSIAFPALEAEAILLALSERGVAASAGAACSSGSLEPSPVLLAMGLAETLAHGSVRFSLSRFTTEAEVRTAAAIVSTCVQAVRGSGSHALRA